MILGSAGNMKSFTSPKALGELAFRKPHVYLKHTPSNCRLLAQQLNLKQHNREKDLNEKVLTTQSYPMNAQGPYRSERQSNVNFTLASTSFTRSR